MRSKRVLSFFAVALIVGSGGFAAAKDAELAGLLGELDEGIRVSKRAEAKDRREAPQTLGAIATAFAQGVQDLRKLQPLLGRLATLQNHESGGVFNTRPELAITFSLGGIQVSRSLSIVLEGSKPTSGAKAERGPKPVVEVRGYKPGTSPLLDTEGRPTTERAIATAKAGAQALEPIFQERRMFRDSRGRLDRSHAVVHVTALGGAIDFKLDVAATPEDMKGIASQIDRVMRSYARKRLRALPYRSRKSKR